MTQFESAVHHKGNIEIIEEGNWPHCIHLRKHGRMHTLFYSLCSFIQSCSLVQIMGLFTWVCFFLSVKLLWRCCPKQPRYISKVILNRIYLAIKTNHHNRAYWKLNEDVNKVSQENIKGCSVRAPTSLYHRSQSINRSINVINLLRIKTA